MIAIGIDTGGTCTDAVIYDAASHQVLSYGKTLTTKKRPEGGNSGSAALSGSGVIEESRHISLSTTLATNACVEGKGGRGKTGFYRRETCVCGKCREPMDCRPSLKFIFCQVTHQKQLARKETRLGTISGRRQRNVL